MTVAIPGSTAAPPDWYPDPTGIGEYRYWDGVAWTPGVVIDGVVTERAVAPSPGDILPHLESASGSLELPPRAAWIGLVGFIAGVVAGLVLGISTHVAGLPDLLVLVAGMTGLWSGLVGACVAVSRRYRTGSLRQDFGLHPGWRDLPRGLLASVAARILGVAFMIPVVVILGSDKVNAQPGLLDNLDRNFLTVFVVACIAVVGAPVVEELFFRGLLQRALLSKIGVPGAVGVQAFLFALVHLSPQAGIDNLLVLAVIFPAGVVFGLAARWRGLGTSMVAHALFNVVAVVASLTLAT